METIVTLEIEGLDQEIHLIEMRGQETISRLFHFQLQLATPSADLSFEQVVGQWALITIEGPGGNRHIQGVIRALEQRHTARKYTVYHATIVPSAWRLTQRYDCRIFQKKNIQQIIETVLGQAKVKYQFTSQRNQDPPAREFCVQYRESDWGFVSRLLEEEGYHYYFEHSTSDHTLKITNDSTVSTSIPGEASLPFHPPGGGGIPGQEHVPRFFLREEVRSGKVSLDDYNFLRPTNSYQRVQSASLDSDLEIYDYPAFFPFPEDGETGEPANLKNKQIERLAEIQLQEQQARRQEGDGDSDCPRLAVGLVFTLKGYRRKDFAKKQLLLTRVEHHAYHPESKDLEDGTLGHRLQYDNSFRCIPRAVFFRPPRVTHRPFVQGVQTAVVVGPKREEIYTDKHGRVKVHFHWDRLQDKKDQNSSCWVRVSQAWAGAGWGAMYIPRIGQEVLVDFMEGNPDRPIITGRVYHAGNVPPLSLPAEKTRSTLKSDSTIGGGGSNEIRFEDKKSGEEIYTHAQKDQNEVVENDMSTRVGHDQTIAIGNNRTRSVGHNETITVGNNRTETVDAEESITIMGNRTESVRKNETVSITQNRSHTVSGSQMVQIRRNSDLKVLMVATELVGLAKSVTVGAAYDIIVGAAMSLTVGASLARTVAGALTESVDLTKTVKVGKKLEIVVGASKLTMDKSGKVVLQGKDFTFKASGPIKFRGASLDIKTSGVINMKGSKVSGN